MSATTGVLTTRGIEDRYIVEDNDKCWHSQRCLLPMIILVLDNTAIHHNMEAVTLSFRSWIGLKKPLAELNLSKGQWNSLSVYDHTTNYPSTSVLHHFPTRLYSLYYAGLQVCRQCVCVHVVCALESVIIYRPQHVFGRAYLHNHKSYDCGSCAGR